MNKDSLNVTKAKNIYRDITFKIMSELVFAINIGIQNCHSITK